MFRIAQSSTIIRQAAAIHNRSSRRALSDATPKSASSPLAGDTGRKATHLHHHMTTLLAISTPLYLLAPNTEGMLDKSFGMIFATTLSAHSWIGMNYVATDYVPKISKALLGPARVFNAVLGVVTFVGLSKIALNDGGGLKGCVKGLWRPVVKEEEEKKD
ncbi:hypothetical protein ACHAXR_005884 [Thalassiosira sp. AJA248-18]